jgi:hypothetical protein
MRNRLLLLAAAVVLSACADDQHATAPASRSGLSGRSASGDAGPSGQATGNPQAKPIDQVGFTKITRVVSPTATSHANAAATATATCPAGTTLVGGGHEILVLSAPVPPFVRSSAGDQNEWSVLVTNSLPGAIDVTFHAIAYCAS